jgi:hypothetical protein
LNLQLCRDHAKHCCWRRFILCQNPAWITQVAKLYRKAQPIVVAAMLACGRQVANAQNVMLQQILLFIWKGEQGFALRGGQEFTAWHATILITNSVFENGDRSVFRYSLKSPTAPRAKEPNSQQSLQLGQRSVAFVCFKSLAYVNFRFLS